MLCQNPVLQTMLNTVYYYSCRWRFSFNARKSCVIVFEKIQNLASRTNGKLETKSYLYKKIIIILANIIQNCKFKSITRRPMLILRNKKLSSGNSFPVPLVNLYKKVVVSPSTLYGCEIWNELKLQDYQLLIKFQHFILKDFQGLEKINTIGYV